ncbi:integrase core domain protein [Elysia marginata]|uniref:Integrase core domain protein n=1 Tax=Elysia marginata TaxID=1093978 RepID=A0AAV4FR06_9GAST|nr:integrase core domain protein [Elysia marginata]
MKAAKSDEGTMHFKLSRFLFAYRNAPHSTTGETPAFMFNRHLRTELDIAKPSIKSKHGQISSQTGFRNYDVEIAPGVIWRRHSDQIVPTSSPVPELKSVPPPIPSIPVPSPATTIATSSPETPGESSNSIQLPSENNAIHGHLPASPKEVRTCPPSRPDPKSSVTGNNKHTQYVTTSGV